MLDKSRRAMEVTSPHPRALPLSVSRRGKTGLICSALGLCGQKR